MVEAKHVVDFPESKSVVEVAIIDTTVRFQQWKIDPFIQEPKIAGHSTWTAPSWAFKITHARHGTYLFDLGVRKDWEDKMPQNSKNVVKKNGWTWTIKKDVADILTENADQLDDIRGIIWSHWHWDHVGDPSRFPTTTKLIVGPGFKDDILPGYPDDSNGRATSDAWKGRELEEVEISTKLVIGGYPALDYFADGSFYLLDTPGHTVGHLCGLARTTPDPDSSFIFMGGDVAHMIGQFRPTEHIPLPNEIRPDPSKPIEGNLNSFCPCAGYVNIHPQKARDRPYYKGSPGMASNVKQAEESTHKLESFDGDDRVFTVIGHDNKLEGIIDVYPKIANQWRQKGWKRTSHWRFLGDFRPKEEK